MKKIGLLLLVAFVVAIAIPAAAGAAEKCPLCGMNMAGNENTAFVVEKTDGTSVGYCCPHCGLWVLSSEAASVKSAKARDFIGGEWVDAKAAVYVYNSKAVPACAPSWIAFAKKGEAEMFIKGFGGELLSYDEAVAKRGTMPKGMDMGGMKTKMK
jgi:nitrous oxide reductase accessory protein NosL